MIRDLLFTFFVLACIWIVLKGLARHQISVRKLSLVLGIWLLLLLGLSSSGFLGDFSTFPPRMMLVLVIPMVTLIWFVLSKKSEQTVSLLPPGWIVKMQGFRVIVELFIWWAYLDGDLPVQMTFEGRNFDILIGLTAPLVAYLWLKENKERPALVITWNVLGILVLLNIVVIAVLSMPTPVQYFTNEPANTIVSTFPWVLLPGILVMLAVSLHLLSIGQMVRFLKGVEGK